MQIARAVFLSDYRNVRPGAFTMLVWVSGDALGACRLWDDLIATVAQRHGFGAGDYVAVWDGLEFDSRRNSHELAITIHDGRSIVITIGETTLGNPWRPLLDIEAAFQGLQRRAQVRDR